MDRAIDRVAVWTVDDRALAKVADSGLLDGAAAHAGHAWWRTTEAAGVPGRFRVVSADGRAALLMPLARSSERSLTVPYTWLFEPIAAPWCDLRPAGAALARACSGVLVLEGIDPQWPGWTGLFDGMRAAGRRVQTFASFANRHERLEGRGWDGYLADRPSALRATIRRRLARAEADPAVRFSLERMPAGVVAGMAAYEAVAARSWKGAEPLPAFLPALAEEGGRAGWLRVSLMRRGDDVIAAQVWSVEHGVAIVHKLAHDAASASMSPGTVLTAWTIRALIAAEAITEVDFGRGDDAYKRGWAGCLRERVGVVVSDPWSLAGATAIARQAAGGLWRRARER